MPFSLAEVANDPDLAQCWTVIRSTGQFAAGGWQNQTVQIEMRGISAIATDRDLEMIPEGDRVTGARLFIASQPLYVTRNLEPNMSGIADQIQFGDSTYRLLSVGPWCDYGYYYAIGVRMSGM